MANSIRVAVVRRALQDGTARQWRERAGLTKSDLARDLGVSESAVGRWESGARTPRPAVALKLAALFSELLEMGE